jgi:hypothetical protein
MVGVTMIPKTSAGKFDKKVLAGRCKHNELQIVEVQRLLVR